MAQIEFIEYKKETNTVVIDYINEYYDIETLLDTEKIIEEVTATPPPKEIKQEINKYIKIVKKLIFEIHVKIFEEELQIINFEIVLKDK